MSVKPGQHCIGILHTQCCPNTPETTSHKKITEAVAQSFFFYLGFLSRTFTNHRTAGKRGGHFFNSNSTSTQTQTTPDSPISSEQPIDFIVNDTKDEEINNLNAEVKALKSFITEQLYVLKKSIEDFKGQENIPNSNSSVLILSLKEELHYLRNENLAKTSIIKSLTENHCVPANINSVLFPQNLHREKAQDDKSSPNKSYESPKTDGKSIILDEIKSQANQKNNQNLRSDNPQKKKTLILGDSIVKHVESWRLNKRMKSDVSVRCIPGTTTNAMKHHLKVVLGILLLIT